MITMPLGTIYLVKKPLTIQGWHFFSVLNPNRIIEMQKSIWNISSIIKPGLLPQFSPYFIIRSSLASYL